MSPASILRTSHVERRALVLAAGLGLVLLGPTPADASAELTSAKPQGSFLSAKLPGEVEHIHAVRDTVVGTIEHHTASSEPQGAELSITATELPGFVTAVTTDGMLYRKARRELLDNYSGRSQGWYACRHAGHVCRKLTYSTGDGRQGMARLYLRDDVLVVVNAVYEDEKIARRFLASVR